MKTMVNGKEIKVWDKNAISAVLTSEVNKMLSAGFVFYFYGGSQGEEAKVCLTNDGGKTVYVFWVHTENENVDGSGKWYERADTMVITGKKYIDVYPNMTLWFNKGEQFFEKKWYEISDRRKNNRYVETMQEYFEIKKLQNERWDVRYATLPSKKLPECANKPALKLVKKIRGYGTTKLKDICSVVKEPSFAGYFVTFTKESRKESIRISAKVR
jgi:hypothetical protein